jgi:hypothetical protein
MSTLLDRYLHEIGKHLPNKNREDILKELRSSLTDALENESGPNPTEAQVSAMLKEFGAPRLVAAKYHPEGQYLVGPALYPLFQMIAGIVLAAVTGAQILAWLVAVFIAGEPVNAFEAAAGLINSLPAVLGWLVIVFAILQRFDVKVDDEEPWEPADLPEIEPSNDVKRTEKVFEIIFQTVFLAILTGAVATGQGVGVYIFPEGTFFGNPVITQYIPWISASLLLAIGLNIYLLWQGRWTKTTRWMEFGLNLVDITLLSLLVIGHQTWLQSYGVTTFLSGIEIFAQNAEANWQIMVVTGFWIGLTVALIVTVIETCVTIYKTARKFLNRP